MKITFGRGIRGIRGIVLPPSDHTSFRECFYLLYEFFLTTENFCGFGGRAPTPWPCGGTLRRRRRRCSKSPRWPLEASCVAPLPRASIPRAASATKTPCACERCGTLRDRTLSACLLVCLSVGSHFRDGHLSGIFSLRVSPRNLRDRSLFFGSAYALKLPTVPLNPPIPLIPLDFEKYI